MSKNCSCQGKKSYNCNQEKVDCCDANYQCDSFCNFGKPEDFLKFQQFLSKYAQKFDEFFQTDKSIYEAMTKSHLYSENTVIFESPERLPIVGLFEHSESLKKLVEMNNICSVITVLTNFYMECFENVTKITAVRTSYITVVKCFKKICVKVITRDTFTIKLVCNCLVINGVEQVVLKDELPVTLDEISQIINKSAVLA